MNYTNHVLTEILEQNILNDKDAKAYLLAMIKVCGNITDEKTGYKVILETTNYEILLEFNKYFSKLYKETLTIHYETKETKKLNVEGIIEGKVVYQLLSDLKIFDFKDSKISKIYKFAELKVPSEIEAFMKGIFVSSGNIYMPADDNDNSGYHLEFNVKEESVADIIIKMLDDYKIRLKKIERDNQISLYVKDSNYISDFLALIGASKAVLELNNTLANRSIRNMVNRQNNCLVANIDKTIEAAQKQLNAIDEIQNSKKGNLLDDKLKDIADVRVQNPEASLDEIAKILNISKSGARHRLNKIIEIANLLQK